LTPGGWATNLPPAFRIGGQETKNPKLTIIMKFIPLFALAAIAAIGFTACDSKKAEDVKAAIDEKAGEAKDAATTKIDDAAAAAKDKAPAAAGAIDSVAGAAKDAAGKGTDAAADAGKAVVDKVAPAPTAPPAQ
jgi:uncharacterized protein YjbJ (UPF0337 family)